MPNVYRSNFNIWLIPCFLHVVEKITKIYIHLNRITWLIQLNQYIITCTRRIAGSDSININFMMSANLFLNYQQSI